MKLLATLPFAVLLAIVAGHASADTLLVDRAKAVPAGAPVRGQSSEQVQAKFGQPQQRLAPEGGQKKQWPMINRWVYPQFTVYFEKDKVIDVVVNQADAGEAGPKPVTASSAQAAPRPHHHPKKKHAAAKPTVEVEPAPASGATPAQ